MKYLGTDVSLQEVPGEISLIFKISNCPHRCKGCHSSEFWSNSGEVLDYEIYKRKLSRYHGLMTCVCFFGGEWDQDNLLVFLAHAQSHGYKTCLYTGAEKVTKELKEKLNYLKTGPWKENRGGLSSISTNQLFLNLDSGECLNHLFQHTQGETHA